MVEAFRKKSVATGFIAKGVWKMYKIISITRWGEPVNLGSLEIIWAGKDSVLAKIKNSGFMKMYSEADCYTVVTEKAG